MNTYTYTVIYIHSFVEGQRRTTDFQLACCFKRDVLACSNQMRDHDFFQASLHSPVAPVTCDFL